MKRLSLFLPFFLLFMSVNAQDIQWSASSKLSWSDFKASPDDSNPFFAVTRAGFGYKYNADQDSIHVTTSTNFKPAQSWVKKPSDHLLIHEQLHFDIAEYFRRIFIERISKATIAFGNAKQSLPDLYSQTIAELRKEQLKYDEETNHSINKELQEKWRLKYQEKLNQSPDKTALHIGFTK
jgi:hypothetical protein